MGFHYDFVHILLPRPETASREKVVGVVSYVLVVIVKSILNVDYYSFGPALRGLSCLGYLQSIGFVVCD